jgi:hypothetical protein
MDVGHLITLSQCINRQLKILQTPDAGFYTAISGQFEPAISRVNQIDLEVVT